IEARVTGAAYPTDPGPQTTTARPSVGEHRLPVVVQAVVEVVVVDGMDRHVLAVALDVDVGQDPVEPAGQPPVAVAQELHGRGDQQHADDGGVEEDGR